MRYDALGAVSELAASQHGAFTRKQAASMQLRKDRIRRLIASGVLAEPLRGVLVLVGCPPTWHQQLMVAVLALGGRGVASHRSAARLHGLDGFERASTLELTSTTHRRVNGTVLHQTQLLDSADIVTIDGVRSTGLARTLCDLGAVVDEASVLRALDSARRHGASMRWIEERLRRLHRPGQSGTATRQRLIRSSSNQRVPDSWFERLVELCLSDPDLPPMVRQHVVTDELGSAVARVDLAFPAIKLAVEAHSRQFHFGHFAEGRDEDRQHRLVRLGWETIYLGYQSTRRPDDALAIVRAAATHRTALRPDR